MINVEINFVDGKTHYLPGQALECEYRVNAADNTNIVAIETSVLWMTVGKGEEDIGVHFFERRMRGEIEQDIRKPVYHLQTVLPRSPLSYAGQIMSVRWAVRVRVILGRGAEEAKDAVFTLGNVQHERILKSPRPMLEIAKTDDEQLSEADADDE
jgi:hypothetical protein